MYIIVFLFIILLYIRISDVKHLGLPPHLGSGIFTHKGEKLRFLVMPRYGRSLENYRVEVGGSLSTFDAFTVARQCSDCLWYMQEQVCSDAID